MELSFLTHVVAFAGGVVLTFSPCTLPLLPAMISAVASDEGGSKVRSATVVAATASAVMLLLLLAAVFVGWVTAPPELAVGILLIALGSVHLLRPGLALKLGVKAPKLRLISVAYGIAYGLSASYCALPILISMALYLVARGVILTEVVAYLAGAFISLFLTSFVGAKAISKLARFSKLVQTVAAVLVIAYGTYLVTF